MEGYHAMRSPETVIRVGARTGRSASRIQAGRICKVATEPVVHGT